MVRWSGFRLTGTALIQCVIERTGKYILKWKGQENTVNSIYEDKKQTVWVTQAKGGLFCYDKVKDSFILYPWPYDEYPTSMTEDHNTPYYWLLLGKGIACLTPRHRIRTKMFGLQKQWIMRLLT